MAGDEKNWSKLVDDLGSEQFARRQSADTALRGGGHAAAAFLSRLESRSLTPEQRLRVQRICQGFADGSTDTPQRTAIWLLGDRSAWIGLLSSQQLETRAVAAEHLGRLMGRPIAFDPRGDDQKRQLQVAELARRIELKK